MPGEVPTTDAPQATPAELPTPYSEVRASPLSFGAGLGEGLEQVGDVAARIGAIAKENDDRVAVQTAEAKSRDAFNQIILDPEKGYASTKGADAMALRQKYAQQFDAAMKDAAAGLTNPVQQRMFAAHAMMVRRAAAAHIASHETAQQNAYAAAQYQGNFEAATTTLEHEIADGTLDKNIDALHQIGINYARDHLGVGADSAAIASVVSPLMQKAAYGGMQAAIATGDPDVAKDALDKLGGFLITGHHKDFAAAVTAMQTKQQVGQSVREILGGASTSVAVPGGPPVGRLDAGKVAAGLAALAPDDPHGPDIVKGVELQQEKQNRVWEQAVAQVEDRIQTAGTDPATGKFNLSAPGVSPADRAWLQKNAPKRLIALGKQAEPENKLLIGSAYNSLYADMINPDKRKSVYGQMSSEQFNATLNDYGLPANDPHRKLALQEFGRIKEAAGKLEEAVPDVVNKTLEKVLPNDKTTREKLSGALGNVVQQFVDDFKATHKGLAPDRTSVSKYAEDELGKGSVTAPGAAPGTFDFNNVRRIDFQTKPENAGKQFNPKEGGAPEFRRVPVVGPKGRFTLPENQVDDFLKSEKGKGFRRG